jgi:phospholipase/lecithinase/hemolysin
MLRGVRPMALALAAAAALAACGGGTSTIDAFKPATIVSFGDETSLLLPDGRRHGVNGLTAEKALDCKLYPVWTQYLATQYGLNFAECNPDNVVDPKAKMRAVAGARAADLAGQIDAYAAQGGFGDAALATVLIGAHDVLALYADYPTRSRSELLADARALGRSVGVQVNRLIERGVKVIVSTVPDQGLTPFALAQKAAYTDINRADLLSDLTYEFNAGIRTTISNDGRSVGLVLADEMTQAMVKSPSSFSLSNVTERVCAATVSAPACTTDTLVSGGNASTWLWADDLNLGPNPQQRLGLLAASRAANNPF